MQSGFLLYKNSKIHYLRSGQGGELLLCFHGYGESAANFDFVLKNIGEDQSAIAIDLPFHGETEWREEEMMPESLREIIQNILAQESLSETKIVLIGFSMGGRIALSISPLFSTSLKKLVLLAPDGLKVNFWYWLATQSLIGLKLFQYTMKHPGWFLGMLKIGNRLGLINKSIFKFVEYYIHDEKVRTQLYQRWMTMRRFKPDLVQLRKLSKQDQIALRLLYGRYDRIILTEPAKRFIVDLPDASIQLLDCGHQVLHEKNTSVIMQATNG